MASFNVRAVAAALVGLVAIADAGASGSGKTTRYWDCCKPSCGVPGKSSAISAPVGSCDIHDQPLSDPNAHSGCDGGNAYMCSNLTPWAIDDNLAYGFAAVNIAGGTEDSWCCACYKLTFTSTAIAGKTLVVQAVNTGGDLGNNQFDLALPGSGVGIFNGCSAEWTSVPDAVWGAQYGGMTANQCSMLPAALQPGCNFRFGWMSGADNPTVEFEQVQCPAELTSRTGCKRSDDSSLPTVNGGGNGGSSSAVGGSSTSSMTTRVSPSSYPGGSQSSASTSTTGPAIYPGGSQSSASKSTSPVVYPGGSQASRSSSAFSSASHPAGSQSSASRSTSSPAIYPGGSQSSASRSATSPVVYPSGSQRPTSKAAASSASRPTSSTSKTVVPAQSSQSQGAACPPRSSPAGGAQGTPSKYPSSNRGSPTSTSARSQSSPATYPGGNGGTQPGGHLGNSSLSASSQGNGSGAPLYGQCGGQLWTGPTTCAQGSCQVQNQWYSQCL